MKLSFFKKFCIKTDSLEILQKKNNHQIKIKTIIKSNKLNSINNSKIISTDILEWLENKNVKHILTKYNEGNEIKKTKNPKENY